MQVKKIEFQMYRTKERRSDKSLLKEICSNFHSLLYSAVYLITEC